VPARPAVADIVGPAADEPEDFDAFAHEPPFRPRRNPAKMWTAAAVAIAALLLVATAALLLLGPQRIGAMTGTASSPPLGLAGSITRQQLESGNALLTVNGRVWNPGTKAQRVPAIRAEILDAGGATVSSWSISPPVNELSPGQSATFNNSEVGVPPTAKRLRLSFGPGV
jgi:hypothetical protein